MVADENGVFKEGVLILILMEYSIWYAIKSRKNGFVDTGLNPYSNGI